MPGTVIYIRHSVYISLRNSAWHVVSAICVYVCVCIYITYFCVYTCIYVYQLSNLYNSVGVSTIIILILLIRKTDVQRE